MPSKCVQAIAEPVEERGDDPVLWVPGPLFVDLPQRLDVLDGLQLGNEPAAEFVVLGQVLRSGWLRAERWSVGIGNQGDHHRASCATCRVRSKILDRANRT